MSRSNKDTSKSRKGCGSDESSGSGMSGEGTNFLVHEIAQITKLRSSPHEHLSSVVPGRMRLPASTVKMLVGREGNYSGRGKFSAADGCHMLSRYLPTKGPWIVDQMGSRAYVSQFSDDGSLFIAGFQGSHIRIYDVDKGWKVMKDISARNLRWTITDTSLSPDRNYLVYASMSPIIHIVNAASATTQSVANVTPSGPLFQLLRTSISIQLHMFKPPIKVCSLLGTPWMFYGSVFCQEQYNVLK